MHLKPCVLTANALAPWHVNYDIASPYPLDVLLKAGADPDNRET